MSISSRDGWTFLTNHGHVLVCLAMDPEVLLRDVATTIGITERAVQQIVTDLERAGAIVRLRVGRRNHYIVRRAEEFRHPVEAGVTIGDFVDLVKEGRNYRQRLPRARPFARGRPTAISSHQVYWSTKSPQPALRRQTIR
jgi:DNA-binding MarR family transcriptional regulator